MGNTIHNTAVIDPSLELGDGVEIGPYVTIGRNVRIGDRTRLLPNCHILNETTVGCDCVISPMAVLGGDPQDLKFHDDETKLVVGDRTRIGEFATLHRGTVSGGGVTAVGNDCMVMAYSHIAHDCMVGDGVVIANASHLSGHTHIEKKATLSGGCFVHQFVTIGELAFICPASVLKEDAPPYMIAEATNGGGDVRFALNLVGLKRNHAPGKSIADLKKAARAILHRKNARTLAEAVELVAQSELFGDAYVANLVNHLRSSLAGRKKRALERAR